MKNVELSASDNNKSVEILNDEFSQGMHKRSKSMKDFRQPE